MLGKSKPRCFSFLNQWTNQIAGDPHLRRRNASHSETWGKFSRVTNWVCSRRLYVQRHAFIFPVCLCLHSSSRSLRHLRTLFCQTFYHSCFHHIRSVFKLHLFHNMKFFTVLSALGLVAAAVAQQTTHNSTVASTLSTSTSASLTPEQSCLAECKLQAP